MVSHEHRPEGGSAKGCLSHISLLHSIWDTRAPSQPLWQGSSQQAAGRQGERQSWGGAQEGQSWCSKGLVAYLSSAAAKAVLLHPGWERVTWLSRKKVWWLEQRPLPNPPRRFGEETLITVPTLPSAALALGGCRNPCRASLRFQKTPHRCLAYCLPSRVCYGPTIASI